jgi:hypothetical protein
MMLIGSTLHTELQVMRVSTTLTFICANQLPPQRSLSFALINCQKENEETLVYVNTGNFHVQQNIT